MGESALQAGVEFRANANGLLVVFNPDEGFNSIYRQIARKLDQGGYFFRTRYFAAMYRGRRLSAEQEREIAAMMADKTGAKTVLFEMDPDYSPPRSPARNITSPPSEDCVTRRIYGSLDREQRVFFDGDIVVFGGVGASASVSATCDIIVLGALRGAVHAGCDGDDSATVVSLAFASPNLKIAGVSAPDWRAWAGAGSTLCPEIAYVEDGEVQFSPLSISGSIFGNPLL